VPPPIWPSAPHLMHPWLLVLSFIGTALSFTSWGTFLAVLEVVIYAGNQWCCSVIVMMWKSAGATPGHGCANGTRSWL